MLWEGGYTQVVEFHYLQHQPDGTPYPERLALSHALMQAAADTGIGLTLLPVLYERAGFTQPALRDDQRRFATSAADVLALCRGVRAAGQPLVSVWRAVHLLRAARPESITTLQRALADDPGPIHPHRRADGRGRRLPGRHRPAAHRLAGAASAAGRPLARCTPPMPRRPRSTPWPGRRWCGDLPQHRGQPGRRPG